TRAEAGCALYVISRSIDVPGRLHIHEEWESLDALAAHGRAAHLAEFRAGLAEIGGVARNVWRREAGAATTL
ncbi:MAG: antibiotic biosynthesis monooxygenase, partial [Pseudomonadota bacterium]|nr:antibiotic biosynthesis monooxygenase [Pseudomonadota bacterium]